MVDEAFPIADRISRARVDADVRGRLLMEYCEHCLRGPAQQAMGPAFGGHLSASDFLQETIGEANRGFANFRGTTEAELIKWLRVILRHNVDDKLRRCRHNAHPLPGDNRESDRSVAADPPGDQTSPSRCAIRDEEETRLHEAVSELPERQRLAVTLRLLQSWRIAEVATALGCTEVAAAGLVQRGVKTLRRKLGPEFGS